MRRSMRRSLLAGTAALVVSVLLSSTAFAASYQPDARIRLSEKSYGNCGGHDTYNNPWTGDNVYNSSAKGQTLKDLQYSGGDCFVTWHYQISIQNGGVLSDRFKIKATAPAVSSGWNIKYLSGSTNITSKVLAGTYQTSTISPGHDQIITVKALYLGGEDLSRVVTATSVGGGAKDAVKFVINETP